MDLNHQLRPKSLVPSVTNPYQAFDPNIGLQSATIMKLRHEEYLAHMFLHSYLSILLKNRSNQPSCNI
jgi:hypothetical protein